MPFIECHIAAGLSQPQKAKLIRDIVKVTHQSIGSDPKIINVILHEHPEHNMAVSGRVSAEASK
jgi:4-oxalocrotonate tautomerase family enzyme